MAGKDKPDTEDFEDSNLFRRLLDDVSPLKSDKPRRLGQRPLPSTRPRQREQDEEQALSELHDGSLDAAIETGDELLFRRPGLQHSVIRKLKSGRYRIDAELDLHGYTVDLARQALSEFLATSYQRGDRCLRVIHGKGIRSGPRGPVLKQHVAHWLTQRDEVLAYASALPRHGGTGAVYVLLRRTRQQS